MTTPSFYIMHGEDEFAIAEEILALKEKLGDPATVALNTIQFDGRTVALADLRSTADTMPFLAKRRLVIVNGLLSRFLSRPDKAEQAEEEDASASLTEFRDALLDYLPQVPPTTALVFVEHRVLSQNNRFLRLVARSNGVGFERRCDPPSGDKLPGWIAKRAKACGGEFTREGAQALASAVGEDTRLLDSEIMKLLAYVDRARPVDLPDVETLTAYVGEVRIFNMVDAMGERQGPAAVKLLHRLLDQPGQYPLAIFAMIIRQFRLLLQARELLAEGATPAVIAGALRLLPFVAAKIAEQCRKFSLAELDVIFRRLLDIDLAIKGGRMDSGLALETFVADPIGWTLNGIAG